MTLEWVSDTEGVTVCSDCWDEEMAEWRRLDGDDAHYCESCLRWHPGLDNEPEPDWLPEARRQMTVEED